MLYGSLAGTDCKLSGAALHWMVSEPTKTVQLFMALYSDYIELTLMACGYHYNSK